MPLVTDNSFAVVEALLRHVPDSKHTLRLALEVMAARAHLRSAGLIRQRFDFYTK